MVVVCNDHVFLQCNNLHCIYQGGEQEIALLVGAPRVSQIQEIALLVGAPRVSQIQEMALLVFALMITSVYTIKVLLLLFCNYVCVL